MSATVTDQHVNGHMDIYLLWHQMLVEHEMNVMYNNQENCTVSRATGTGISKERRTRVAP